MGRTWISVCLLVMASDYPQVQAFGISFINFIALRLNFLFKPYNDAIGNVSRTLCDVLILFCSLLFVGLIPFSGPLFLFELTANIIFYVILVASVLPLICFIIQQIQMFFSKKAVPIGMTKKKNTPELQATTNDKKVTEKQFTSSQPDKGSEVYDTNEKDGPDNNSQIGGSIFGPNYKEVIIHPRGQTVRLKRVEDIQNVSVKKNNFL